MNSCRRANGNHILFTRVSSNLPTFLGGIQLKAFYLTNVPPIFGKKIFTIPWTTTDAFGFPIEFFHSFPFSKGETLSPPFGKGRVGGISGQAFSKRQSDSHFHNSPRMTEEQKLKDIFFRRARRVHREDLKKNDLPWGNILVFFLPCEPCSRSEREKSFCFSPSRMPRLRKWSEVLARQDRNGR